MEPSCGFDRVAFSYETAFYVAVDINRFWMLHGRQIIIGTIGLMRSLASREVVTHLHGKKFSKSVVNSPLMSCMIINRGLSQGTIMPPRPLIHMS